MVVGGPKGRQIPFGVRQQPDSPGSITPQIPSKMKTKRSHSPSLTTHAKVQHSSETSDASGGRRRNLSFDEVFYDEVILVIFSYLSAGDLCAIQPTNKNWARLSRDNQVHSKRDVHEVHEGLTRGDPYGCVVLALESSVSGRAWARTSAPDAESPSSPCWSGKPGYQAFADASAANR